MFMLRKSSIILRFMGIRLFFLEFLINVNLFMFPKRPCTKGVRFLSPCLSPPPNWISLSLCSVCIFVLFVSNTL